MSAAVEVAKALARPRGPARLVPPRLRGALLRATVSLLLRDTRLDDLLELLAGSPAGRTAAARRPAWAEAEAAAAPRATVGALRRLPATCLHRALAAYATLQAAGVPARFVIGVRREADEVLAHAWIEHAGEPVGEPVDPRLAFAVAYAHPPGDPAQPAEPPRPLEEHRMLPPRTSPDVLLTKLADGTGVLLHLRTKFYFTLNRTGVVAWETLAGPGPSDPDAIVEVLASRFDGIDRALARDDVQALLRELEAEGLLAPGP